MISIRWLQITVFLSYLSYGVVEHALWANGPICRGMSCTGTLGRAIALFSDNLQSREMGSLCSKSSALSGGHTLASPTPIDNSGRLPQQQQGPRQHPQTADARRSQAAAAAEQRITAVTLPWSLPPPS